jgi:hypothetical protein
MSQKLLYLLLIPAFFVACDTKEKEVLQSQVDSLTSELQKSFQAAQTLTEVGILLDSIDASRCWGLTSWRVRHMTIIPVG